MTKETKVRLLQTILNAGIKGTDREMLDNLKAVIKSIENEGVGKVMPALQEGEEFNRFTVNKNMGIIPKKKAGRPKKR